MQLPAWDSVSDSNLISADALQRSCLNLKGTGLSEESSASVKSMFLKFSEGLQDTPS